MPLFSFLYLNNYMEQDIVTKIAGIDYSMSCPCICVYNGPLSKFNARDCNWFFLTDKKTLGDNFFYQGRINSEVFKEWRHPIQRYKNIASWAIQKLQGCSLIIIEDYSMGSKGRVFHIAENCGILKHELYVNELPFDTVPPTTLKKFASGKGNASKEMMYESFLRETNIDIKNYINPKLKESDNPISDVIDSFYLAKYCAFEYLSL